MMRPFIYSVLAIMGCALCLVGAQADVFGLKAQNISPLPTVLFSFKEDGSQFSELGTLTLDSSNITADGLAISPTYGLMGFQIVGSDSRLIAISPSTAQATVVGSFLIGREIRGAVFDFQDNIRAIDVTTQRLLTINPLTGSILRSVALSVPVSDACDIAIEPTGRFIVESAIDSGTQFYDINIETGSLTAAYLDSERRTGDALIPQALTGLTFSQQGTAGTLYGSDGNGQDDIYAYHLPDYIRETRYTNIISRFNAGFGDLAALVVPNGALVSGRVTLQGAIDQAQPVTFEFRPTDGTASFQRVVTLNANRTYSIQDVPRKVYTLWVKGERWLARTRPLDTTNGNVTNVNFINENELKAGDANNDNSVDALDLADLITAFNTDGTTNPPDPMYNSAADFNTDGFVDALDLGLLIENFNTDGAP